MKVLPFKPFLMKPNHHELGEIFNTVISTPEEAIPYAKELVNKGAQNVMVSFMKKGALFINKETVLYANALKGEVKSSIGSGDSMVAGFIGALREPIH